MPDNTTAIDVQLLRSNPRMNEDSMFSISPSRQVLYCRKTRTALQSASLVSYSRPEQQMANIAQLEFCLFISERGTWQQQEQQRRRRLILIHHGRLNKHGEQIFAICQIIEPNRSIIGIPEAAADNCNQYRSIDRSQGATKVVIAEQMKLRCASRVCCWGLLSFSISFSPTISIIYLR